MAVNFASRCRLMAVQHALLWSHTYRHNSYISRTQTLLCRLHTRKYGTMKVKNFFPATRWHPRPNLSCILLRILSHSGISLQHKTRNWTWGTGLRIHKKWTQSLAYTYCVSCIPFLHVQFSVSDCPFLILVVTNKKIKHLGFSYSRTMQREGLKYGSFGATR